MPTMITVMTQKMAKVEKTFKVLGIDGEATYAFGEKISYTDLGKGFEDKVSRFKVKFDLLKECLFCYVLSHDAFVNQYIDAKKLLAESGPTVLKVAQKAMKHPKVAQYMAEEGNKPFFGINTLW